MIYMHACMTWLPFGRARVEREKRWGVGGVCIGGGVSVLYLLQQHHDIYVIIHKAWKTVLRLPIYKHLVALVACIN